MYATLLKMRLQYRCFLVSFVKFQRRSCLRNTCKRLLLKLFARLMNEVTSHQPARLRITVVFENLFKIVLTLIRYCNTHI